MSSFKQQLDKKEETNQQSKEKSIQNSKEMPKPSYYPHKLWEPSEFPKPPRTQMCIGMNGCDFEFLVLSDVIKKTIKEEIK
ncbi:unnamed protein product [Paramecium pentaurelia]|uniref:Uncharacterized protein n=1 Tax=Paramecium pentaurelia TaxID=43138 RepID=A0A8S1WMJ5_9CILI|nr:unnamed protein product [Paramecium pentaurelia]